VTWGLVFRVRQYLKGSLWVIPLVGGFTGVLLAVALADVHAVVTLPVGWQYSAGTAQAVLASVVGAAVGLTGFVVTVSVLVVQMATGTFSARYMRLFYRDAVLKSVLAVLIGTFTFSFGLLRRVEQDSVPNLGVTVAGFLMGTGLLLFVIFLDRFVRRLRPVAVASLVAAAGRRAFREVVAQASGDEALDVVPAPFEVPGAPDLVVRAAHGGAIQAVDLRGLVAWARTHDCVVVVRHPIGDFVPAGAAVIEVYGKAAEDALAAERRLGAMIALGVERTIEQDPAFAIRIMVDIAVRALSPAVNDPTTAVQVIDHLEDLLGLLGKSGPAAPTERSREATTRGVVIPIRSWDDYMTLGLTEIREYGGASIQVMRRLRAMLEELHGSVHPDHRGAVDDQLVRLDAWVAARWRDSPDLDLAGRSDRQGIGGPGSLAPPPAVR
jgi:uncharacterized membrane protein